METQPQVRVHGPGDVRVDDVAVVAPGDRDAVVRVAACGICGSDVGYANLGGVAGPADRPMPLGHELSGIVESVGASVRSVEVGDRVVLDPLAADNLIGNGGSEGGFTPRLLVRKAADARCLIPIPDALSFEVAALAEPLGVGMRAVDQAGVVAGQSAVVFGAGPIGLATVACLRRVGASEIVAIDTSATRLSVARKLGAHHVLDATREDVFERIREVHGTASVMGAPMAATDVYIEATGVSSVIGDVIAHARAGATLSVVALHRQPVPVSFLLVMMKEIHIVGSIAQPDDWGRMIEMLCEVDLSPMISHRFPLEQFSDGLAIANDPSAGAKVMIRIDPDAA